MIPFVTQKAVNIIYSYLQPYVPLKMETDMLKKLVRKKLRNNEDIKLLTYNGKMIYNSNK